MIFQCDLCNTLACHEEYFKSLFASMGIICIYGGFWNWQEWKVGLSNVVILQKKLWAFKYLLSCLRLFIISFHKISTSNQTISRTPNQSSKNLRRSDMTPAGTLVRLTYLSPPVNHIDRYPTKVAILGLASPLFDMSLGVH